MKQTEALYANRHAAAQKFLSIAFGVILVALRAANEEGTLRVDDPEIVTRFLWGALRRGAILVATSPTRSAPATPFPSMRALVWGLCCDSSE